MRILPTTICCLSLISVLVGCGHDQRSFYAARSDAEKSGEFERGWLPDFLPKSSHAIHLTYDLSPSQEWCGFAFDPADAGKLLTYIKPVNPLAPPISRVPNPRVSWWPKVLQGNLDVQAIQQTGFVLYSVTRPISQAHNETLLFAIDPKNGRAYFYGN